MIKLILWRRKVSNTFLTTENRRKLSPKAIFLAVLSLVILFTSQGMCFGKSKEAGDIIVTGIPPESSLKFADVDKNDIIDDQELQFFQQNKLETFDTNHNSVLDKPEMDTFNLIDKKLSKGGENPAELTDEQNKLYREWRDFILSLKLRSKFIAGQNLENAPARQQAAKCYPDKICDDPLSPYYNTKDGPNLTRKTNNNPSIPESPSINEPEKSKSDTVK